MAPGWATSDAGTPIAARPHVNSRRRFLLLGTTAMATIVAACCRLPSSRIDAAAGRGRPARLPIAHDGGDGEDLPLCIDVHCHIFNGQDVDVAGFIRGPVASDVSPELHDFLKALADLAAEVVYGIAPSGADEATALDARLPPERGLESATDPAAAVRQRERALDVALAQQLAERFRGTDIKQKYQAGAADWRGLESALPPPEPADFTADELQRILSDSADRTGGRRCRA
ncbi:hypothetical protein HQ394_09785 [Defluviicoccus vanus]|uniref:Uncharacterized protein n=1 Tax=Defluviicoccus vanus TaxID=111831 RepID=A0A7H1N1I0_9PROT|nr:hypothetical protein HQ394_09785 [Defluviicoccus vanus]